MSLVCVKRCTASQAGLYTSASNLKIGLPSFVLFVSFAFRICGSYEAMGLGRISEALQDFTGGVVEVINLKQPPNDLFSIMHKAQSRQSLMGCSIEASEEHDVFTIPVRL